MQVFSGLKHLGWPSLCQRFSAGSDAATFLDREKPGERGGRERHGHGRKAAGLHRENGVLIAILVCFRDNN